MAKSTLSYVLSANDVSNRVKCPVQQALAKKAAAKIHALHETAANRSLKESAGQYDLKIQTNVKDMKSKVAGEYRDSAYSNLRAKLNEIKDRKDKKVDLTPHKELSPEMRAAYRASNEKPNMLKRLAEDNKAQMLAAITKVDCELTGITPEMQDQYNNLIYSLHAAEELVEEAEAVEAFETVLIVLDIAGRMADDLADPARLAQIERSDQEARQAQARFTDA